MPAAGNYCGVSALIAFVTDVQESIVQEIGMESGAGNGDAPTGQLTQVADQQGIGAVFVFRKGNNLATIVCNEQSIYTGDFENARRIRKPEMRKRQLDSIGSGRRWFPAKVRGRPSFARFDFVAACRSREQGREGAQRKGKSDKHFKASHDIAFHHDTNDFPHLHVVANDMANTQHAKQFVN